MQPTLFLRPLMQLLGHPSGTARLAVLTLLLAVVAGRSTLDVPVARAHDADPGSHSLTVVVAFPDDGLGADERLCLTLFSGDDAGLVFPLDVRCLGPGEQSTDFGGLSHGTYQLVVPSPDSVVGNDRYEGQVLVTEVPNDPEVESYVVDVALTVGAVPAAVTGRIVVNAFVCAPGTEGGDDADAWAVACPDRGDNIAFDLTPADGAAEAARTEITGVTNPEPGTVVFADLAAGTYNLVEIRPDNVEEALRAFVTSDADGSVTVLPPDGALAVETGETLTVDVYNVIAGGTTEDAPTVEVGTAVGEPDANEAVATDDPSPAPSGPQVVRLPNTGTGDGSAAWAGSVALGVALILVLAAALTARGAIHHASERN